jgi:hypothetical protein
MKLFKKNPIWYLSLLIVFCLGLIIFPYFNSQNFITIAAIDSKTTNYINEPIQPTPLKIDLDREKVKLGVGLKN